MVNKGTKTMRKDMPVKLKGEHKWLEYCPSCKRKHRVSMQPCLHCAGRGGYTPQPVSNVVYGCCRADYRCDGCYTFETEVMV